MKFVLIVLSFGIAFITTGCKCDSDPEPLESDEMEMAEDDGRDDSEEVEEGEERPSDDVVKRASNRKVEEEEAEEEEAEEEEAEEEEAAEDEGEGEDDGE